MRAQGRPALSSLLAAGFAVFAAAAPVMGGEPGAPAGGPWVSGDWPQQAFFFSEGHDLDEIEPDSAHFAPYRDNRDLYLAALEREAMGLILDEALDDYLDGVLIRLTEAKNDLPSMGFNVVTQASEEVAASIKPDLTVSISTALLASLETEDAVAFVIAHEMAHGLLKHVDPEWLKLAQEHALVAGHLAGYGIHMVDRSITGGSDKLGEIAQTVDRGRVIAMAAYSAHQSIVRPALHRDEEEAADLLGLQIMTRAGYDPLGALEVMEVLVELDRREKQESDHLQTLAALADQAMRKSNGDFFDTVENAGNSLSAIIGALEVLGVTELYFSGEHRRRELLAYAKEEMNLDLVALRERQPATTTAAPWAPEAPRSNLADLIRSYRATTDAYQALVTGDLDRAQRLSRIAVSGSTSRHALPRAVFAEVRLRQGDAGRHRQNIAIAAKNPNAPIGLFIYAARAAMTTGDYRRGERYLDDAEARYGKALPLYRARFDIYSVRRDRSSLETHVNYCESGAKELAGKCRRIAEESWQQARLQEEVRRKAQPAGASSAEPAATSSAAGEDGGDDGGEDGGDDGGILGIFKRSAEDFDEAIQDGLD